MKSPGLTLIEVIAGLAILGTLLSLLVVARSRYLHQWALAGRKQDAAHAADQLLSGWWAKPEKIPRRGEGELANASLKWRTEVVEDKSADQLGVQIVRLSVYEKKQVAGETTTDTRGQTPLIRVDLVMNPEKSSPEKAGDESDGVARPSAAQTPGLNQENP